MAELIIKSSDENITKILALVSESDIDYSLTSKRLTINASDKKHKEVIVRIMELAEDYILE